MKRRSSRNCRSISRIKYEQALSRGASEEEAYQTALTGLAESDLGELKRIGRRVQREALVLRP